MDAGKVVFRPGVEAGALLGGARLEATITHKAVRTGQLNAIGIRADIGAGLVSSSAAGFVGGGLYADFRLSRKWELEVIAGGGVGGSAFSSGGALVGAAIQFDPPSSPLQVNVGTLAVIGSSAVVAPDVSLGFMW